MTRVEIRYKPTIKIPKSFKKIVLELDLDEALEYVLDIYTEDVQFMYLKEEGSDTIIKLEFNKTTFDKSFMLNLLDL